VGVVDNPWLTPYQHPTFADMLAPESLHATEKHVFSGDYTPVTVHPSSDVEQIVAQGAGAFPHDVVTTQMLSELASKTGSWGVDIPGDLLEGLTPASPPPDADNDGMDDAWETDHGLDPSDGSDHAKVMESGYTAIEEYINGEANEVAPPTPPGEGSSSSSSAASGGGETSSASGGAADPSAPPAASDEGCTVGSPATRSHAALLLGFIAFATALRRRRRA
jgi:MYXO-CTERM domain-containing protein